MDLECPLFNTWEDGPDMPTQVLHARCHRKRQAVQKLLAAVPAEEKQRVVRLALRRLETEGLGDLPEVVEEIKRRTLQDKAWEESNARFDAFLNRRPGLNQLPGMKIHKTPKATNASKVERPVFNDNDTPMGPRHDITRHQRPTTTATKDRERAPRAPSPAIGRLRRDQGRGPLVGL